jgi:hypothetical protein
VLETNTGNKEKIQNATITIPEQRSPEIKPEEINYINSSPNTTKPA